MSIVINEKDNIEVCLTAEGDIPAGHKRARRDIGRGEPIIKYGEVIGRATCDIKEGEWVHTHNLRSQLDEEREYRYEPSLTALPKERASFLGYRRTWGRAGIRNEIYIIPTVGCVNSVCARLRDFAVKNICGSIDGVYAFPHQFGCSQLGEDNENIKKLLCSIALNPNATAVLFVGLGCENNGLDGIRAFFKENPRDEIAFITAQNCDEIAEGERILLGFIERAKALKREECDLSELCIGLKCGGSDGYSGLTANTLVGKISDRAIGAGASAVLTEVPEMFGAEQLLMNKCKDEPTFLRYKKMITDFKAFYTDNGFPVYENPSPGNKAGGISTLEEKSLGCIKKAGSGTVVDILGYGERVKEQGLSLLNAPGNDLIASTALGASGCQIVLFTTGRGTPFSTFVPTMKIASNSALAQKKQAWIDFDAYPMDEHALWELIVRTLNGDYKCKSEDFREIAFYKTGVTL